MNDNLWAGTEASYQIALEAQVKIAAKFGEASPEEVPLLQIINGVGVINVDGPIVNHDSPWNALFGVTSYPAISNAMVSAAKNPDVKNILMAFDSPGGSVAGVAEAADLIGTINDRVKPVTAYAEGGALSAAYWLASSAGKVYASKTASVGSVGVIMTHTEHSQAEAKEGTTTTVMRAGKYKALASPHEPLSGEARAQIQENLDAAYNVFANHVADSRGLSLPAFEATAGQGRVFFGENAQHVGLIDGIKGFSQILSDVSLQTVDKMKYNGQNFTKLQGAVDMKTKKMLTEVQIAALASGVPVENDVIPDKDPVAEVPVAEVPVAEVPVAEVPVQPVAAVEEQPNQIVQMLKAQLASASDALVDAKVNAKDIQNKLDAMTAAQEPMLAIIGKSLNNMQVALGAAMAPIAGRSVSDVLAEHSRVSDVFSSKFKAGGVAALDATESLTAAVPQADSLHKARMAATQTNRKGA